VHRARQAWQQRPALVGLAGARSRTWAQILKSHCLSTFVLQGDYILTFQNFYLDFEACTNWSASSRDALAAAAALLSSVGVGGAEREGAYEFVFGHPRPAAHTTLPLPPHAGNTHIPHTPQRYFYGHTPPPPPPPAHPHHHLKPHPQSHLLSHAHSLSLCHHSPHPHPQLPHPPHPHSPHSHMPQQHSLTHAFPSSWGHPSAASARAHPHTDAHASGAAAGDAHGCVPMTSSSPHQHHLITHGSVPMTQSTHSAQSTHTTHSTPSTPSFGVPGGGLIWGGGGDFSPPHLMPMGIWRGVA
jgi:hypothetical protein